MTGRALHHQLLGAAVALLTLISGCAQRSDWVEGTLVTVDVTGVWKGRMTVVVGGRSGEMEMTLTQRGPKVTGDGRIWSYKMSIEGIVRGDVFSFKGAAVGLQGEARVTADEMSGEGRADRAIPGYVVEVRFALSR